MPSEIFRQANFTGGELDPSCLGRRDLKAYTSSLAYCENHLSAPQGPIRRRPGLAHVDLIRNRIEAYNMSAPVITAPNGGVVAGLYDGTGMVTTGDMGAAAYVVAEVDFGVAVPVCAVDLIDVAFVVGPDDTPEAAPPQYPWWKRNPEDPFEVLP